MTLLQLQYFRELGKTLHYTKAAEHLHISQPGLSYSISELEKELGSKLFEKENRKFRLTAGGEVFMQYVERALDTLNEGVDAFHSASESSEEQVGLGYFHSISSLFIPQLVKSFYLEDPRTPVLFNFVQDLGPNLVEALKARTIDLAFCPDLDPSLEGVPVMAQSLYLAVPSTHPLAMKKSVAFSDFSDERIIMLGKDTNLRRMLEQIFKDDKKIPRRSFELQECSTVQQFVTLEMGVAIVPQMPELRIEGLVTIPINDVRFKRLIYCAWLRGRKLPLPVRTVRDFILSHYGEA